MSTHALLRLLRHALQHHQQRRDYHHLLKLDEHLLADIGLTREQIQRELQKPYRTTFKSALRCNLSVPSPRHLLNARR
ncbi:MAG: DUF1127 domain-containing protein [Halopseudomonas sp.]|uniref:DUF1127 domain-containing protein n=1 Tax=Halopseudomonas sp. TaxID=2901191 RepID=UPI0030033878